MKAPEAPMKALPVLLLAALLPTPPMSAASREPRRLLERQAEAIALPQVLASADAFRPYPTVADRAAWAGVPEERRRAFVAEAEKQLATEWAILPATRFLDYVRDGNRGRYESLLFSRRGKLADLVLGELVEGEGPLHRRDRGRGLAHLRGDLLGRARPRRRPEARVGPSRRDRAHRRPLRRRDGGAPRLDGLR